MHMQAAQSGLIWAVARGRMPETAPSRRPAIAKTVADRPQSRN